MELVYVVSADAAPRPAPTLQPLTPERWCWLNRAGRFVPREPAETDERTLQVIPYATVIYGGRVFLTRRIQKSTETRLLGRASVGVGGHLNPEDLSREIVTWGLFRELWEEVGVRAEALKPLGLIRTDASPVERVHLGVFFAVWADRAPRVAEPHKLEGRLATLAEVEASFDALEGWSRVALPALRGINLYSV